MAVSCHLFGGGVVSWQEIKAELRALRAGRAVHAANLTARLGDHLRMLCANAHGVSAGVQEPAQLRQQAIAELDACARRLPEDVALAVRVALGLHAQASDRQFQGRVAWLARQLGREERTALRRIDEAEVLLAEEISRELDRRRGQTAGDGWHVVWGRVTLRLDAPRIEAYEDRLVVADRDGIEEITLGLSLPGAADGSGPQAHADVRYGGLLVRHERPTLQRSQLVVRLPMALAAGERCEVGIVIRLGVGQHMRSHYVLTSTRPYEHFQLRVRFHPDRLPRWVRRVAGEPVRMLDVARLDGQPLTINSIGEVVTEFERPAMYLAYGAQWWPPPDQG